MENVEVTEVTARTVREAVALGLEQLGKTEDEVAVTVLTPGKPAQLLAFGAEPARVRLEIKSAPAPVPAPLPVDATSAAPPASPPAETAEEGSGEAQATSHAEFARLMLDELLRRMALNLTIEVKSIDPITLNVVGPDVAELIGRRGSTLRALQFVLSLMVNKQLRQRVPLIVDADGYRERREELLHSMAERLAQRVRVTRQPMALEPMAPNERRLVHLALVDDPDVTSESEGEGDSRRVVLRLRTPADPAASSPQPDSP